MSSRQLAKESDELRPNFSLKKEQKYSQGYFASNSLNQAIIGCFLLPGYTIARCDHRIKDAGFSFKKTERGI